LRIFILLDRSGSMAPRWQATLDAINEYVAALALNQATREAEVTLAAFDAVWSATTYEHLPNTYYGLAGRTGATLRYQTLRNGQKASQWAPLSHDEAVPGGGTPLYDAIGHMDELIIRQAGGLTGDFGDGVIVIVTDGEENVSAMVNKDGARIRLDRYRAKDWGVVFLGADFEAFGQAQQVGIAGSSVLNTSGAEGFRTGMMATARNTAAYASAKAAGVASAAAGTMVYTDEDREESKK
jgi:hypothetical protein